MVIFIAHLAPIEIDDAGKHVCVELRVLDVAEVLSQCLTWQRLGLSPAAFVPSDIPPVVKKRRTEWPLKGQTK